MKYNYLLLLLFLVGVTSHSQLYVSPATYVYANDQYVYVTGKVELNAATSNFYLRNQSQLLQGTAAVGGANTGLGALSVFQEGTSNNYHYNYWCSPVGGALAVAGNSNFGITQLGVPTTAIATTPASILGLGNYDGVSGTGTLSIASHWIWTYSVASSYGQWVRVAGLSNILPGQGFSMKGTMGLDPTVPHTGAGPNKPSNAQRYDFRGKPNDGTINVPVAAGTETLTGNPYPSAIDMRIFLFKNPGPDLAFGTGDDGPLENPLCDGNALYWETDKTINTHYLTLYRGGYGIYNGASGNYIPATFYAYNGSGTQLGSTGTGSPKERRFAPIGQGFNIRGVAAGNVQIKNTHRVYKKEGKPTNSEFEKSATPSDFYEETPNLAGIDYTKMSRLETPHIKINTLLNNEGIKQMNLAFMDSALDGVDRADALSATIADNLPCDTYFVLDNTEYIQSTTAFNINNKYPLGFKNTSDAVYRIQVAEFVNFEGAENVYLHDKTTDLYHNIKNAGYDFSLPAGVNNHRFEITFVDNVLSTNDNIASNFDVFQNNGSGFLTIKNPKAIDLKSFAMYDVSGKTIWSKGNLGNNLSYEYNTVGLSKGVYIVKLTTSSNQEVTKKVSVF